MLLRVRHPNTPPKDVDLGPAVGRHHDYATERKTVDDLPRGVFRQLADKRR